MPDETRYWYCGACHTHVPDKKCARDDQGTAMCPTCQGSVQAVRAGSRGAGNLPQHPRTTF